MKLEEYQSGKLTTKHSFQIK